MIELIMTKDGDVVHREKITEASALELLTGAILGLVPDQKSAQQQIHDSWKAVTQGRTIEIENKPAGTSMVFQIFRQKKPAAVGVRAATRH